MKPHCEAAFEAMAREDMPALVRLIESGDLRPTDLSFAAEIAGRDVQAGDVDSVIAALIPLLRRPEVYVQEGAILGLTPHAARSDVRAALTHVAEGGEAHPVIASMAREVLNDDA